MWNLICISEFGRDSMKIAFFNAYQANVKRGAERYVEELSKRLNKNHEVIIFSDRKYPLNRWPLLWRVFLDPQGLSIFWFTFKNLYKVWKKRFDIVVPLNGGWQPALIRLITWLYGGKMVISGQSGIGWDDRNNLWCFPDYFVALSSFAQNWAKRVNPFVRIVTIPNGVDTKNFTPGGSSIKLKLKKPIYITVGALTKTKRINLVIKAVAELKDASLLVVGDGELKKEIEVLGESLLKDRFQLMKVPFKEMSKAYRATDVFTLVSEPYHSFEIAIVEAMATGLPVVVNDDQIRREIVGDAGIFVDPTDTKSYSQELKKALQKNWEDKPRRQAQKFSWEKIAKDYGELFIKLKG